ncbi:hypothetical protein MBANPS3_003457 [Mucor bainieri]
MSMERLPVELLNQVFCFIDSVQDLAQCRLVSKQLNHTAEKAMFLKPITVGSVSAAKALLYHLKRNKEMGKLIKSLDFKTVSKKKAHVYLDMLPLLFTPAMERFQGDIRAPIFFRRLVSIAKASNTSFSNLKVIPTELLRGSKEYYKAVFYFRETLQELHISWHDPPRTPWRAFSRLGELDHLTRLTIDGEISSVLMLDRMLSKCNHLQTLSVMLLGVMPMVVEEDELLDWMETHVEKVPSVTKLVIEKSRQPDLVEYLLFKYPNVEEAIILLSEPEYYENQLLIMEDAIWVEEEPDTEALERIMLALQWVPFYRIGYMDHIFESVLEAIDLYLEDYEHGAVVTYGDGPSPGWMDIKLPVELLSCAFSYIDSLQDLAQCRLVCKHLNHPAERAMFGKPIVVSSAAMAKALRYHLVQNQELGKLITALFFRNKNEAEADEFTKLLPFVFTPVMEQFRGSIKSPQFFKRLVDIAEASNTTFSDLLVLPTEEGHCSEEYSKALLYFGDSLEHVEISYQKSSETPWHLFNRLGEVIYLTSLFIDGGVESVEDLHHMLEPCTHLEELKVEANGEKQLMDGEIHMILNKEGLVEWIQEEDVQQDGTLTKVEVQGSQQPDIIEYLVYKHPNLTEASVFLAESGYYDYYHSLELGYVHRIIDALQSVPLYRLCYMEGAISSILKKIQDYIEAHYPHKKISLNKKGPPFFWVEMEVVDKDDNVDA